MSELFTVMLIGSTPIQISGWAALFIIIWLIKP